MSSLLRSTLVVSACNAAVQALNFVTQALVARQFGAGAELDGYWVAAAASQFVTAVGVTAVQLAFLPEQLAQRRDGGEAAARRLRSGVVNTMSGVLLLLALAAILARGPLLHLLAPGLNDVAFRAAASVALVLWPAVVLSGILQIQVADRQGVDRFLGPALLGVAGGALVAALVVLLGPKIGILGFAVATVTGLALQVALLAAISRDSTHAWSAGPREPGVARVFALSFPLMVSALFSGAGPLIERHLASAVGVGAISQLAYASRIVTAEMILVTTGLATVLFPRFARQTVANDALALGRLFSASLRYATVILLPLCVATFVLARPLITFAFQRGSFGPEDSEHVARILRVYALALPPMALGTLVGRVMYSLRANRVVALMAAGYLAAYWLLAARLARDWGAAGIAAASAVCLAGGFLFGLAYVRTRTPRDSWAGVGPMLLKTVAAVAAAALAMRQVRDAIETPAASLLAAGVAGAAAYVLVLAALRSSELREIARQLRAAPPATGD